MRIKKQFTYFAAFILAFAVFFSLSMPALAAGDLNNGGFENGNLYGWTAAIPSGGSVQIAMVSHGLSSVEGRYHALLKTNSTPNHYTTLSQSFYASAGAKISGWSYFKTTDYMPYNDDSSVILRNASGYVIGTLFSASVSTVGDYGIRYWTYWEHTFSAAGTYTIEARVANQRDGGVDSFLGIDGVRLQGTVNRPPVAIAGPNQVAEATSTSGAFVTLNGSGSYDPDGNPLYFTWKGPFGTLSGSAVVTVPIPMGTHLCTLTVSDGRLDSSATLQVHVRDTTPPVLTVPGDIIVEASALETPVDIGKATAYDIFPVTLMNDAPLLFRLGTTLVTWTATDANGNRSTGVQSVTVYDDTPPVIETNIEDGSVFALNQEVVVHWSASDDQSGIASIVANVEDGSILDTSQVGMYSFTITATDHAGNVTEKIVSWSVHYVFEGFVLPSPAVKNPQYKVKSTIPVAFRLKDFAGVTLSTAVARLDYSSDGVVWIPARASGKSNEENVFRYDADDEKYIFNFSTMALRAGQYTLRVSLDDGTTQFLPITLR